MNAPLMGKLEYGLLVNESQLNSQAQTGQRAHWQFPGDDVEKTIFIQQDNACPHIVSHDPDFIAAAQNQGIDLKMETQSANSPAENINALVFYCNKIIAARVNCKFSG